MKGLSVSSIRVLIGDCNRSINDANIQLLELDEKINNLMEILAYEADSDKEIYNTKLNALLLKKDILKSDIIAYEEKINVCNKLLYDFALNSILSSEESLNNIISQIIDLKQSEIDSLKNEIDIYNSELILRKNCCSLYSFKGRNYMFESLISTPISREQYVKYFVKELDEANLLDSIYDLVLKYDSDLSNYVDEFKNIDVLNNVEVFFDEYALKPDWKKFFSTLKFYSEVLENYKFCDRLKSFIDESNLSCFEDNIYFPGFKSCTKEDIKKYYEKLPDGDLKKYMSQFNFDDLSLLDVYCIVYKLKNNHKFILNDESFIYENDQEIYKLSKIVSISESVIDNDKSLIEKLNGDNKRDALIKYFGGLYLNHDFMPIDSMSNVIVDDINKIVDNYQELLAEQNKIIDMISCYEKGPLYPLFAEFGSDKENFKIGDNVLSLDLLKTIVLDVNNFNLNIRHRKTDVSELLTVIENLNKKVEFSKKTFNDYVSDKDNIIFTNKKGRVVKNKFFRFFFKLSRQYKDNVNIFETKKTLLENEYESLKNEYNLNYDEFNALSKSIDVMQEEKDKYISENNANYEGIVDKAMRYNTYLENNGYDMYANYLNLEKSLDVKRSEIEKLSDLYSARISELLCISNLPQSYIEKINDIVDSGEFVKLDYVDKKYTDYYSKIYNRYNNNSFAFDNLILNNYDYNMDEDEAIYGLVGKIKKKFR